DARGSVRVKALADGKMYSAPSEGVLVLPLQITPEPRLAWRKLVEVRLDKALDDNDQALARGSAVISSGSADEGVRAVITSPNLHQHTPLALKKGDKESRSLKELSGTVVAEVFAESQPLIVAGNILEAGGKTFTGADKGELKVNKVEKAADGTLTLRFEMLQPAGSLPDSGF